MKKTNQTFVFIFVLSLFLSYTAAQTIDPALLDLFLSEMNEARRSVNPPANPPIQDLVYNSTLGDIAWNLDNTCGPQSSIPPQYGIASSFVPTLFYLENITFTEAAARGFNYTGFRGYNYIPNTCNSGLDCSEYVQIISSKSTQVGCAQIQCILHFSGTLFLCLFNHHANFTIERPYSVDGTGGSVSSTSIPSISTSVPSISLAPSSSSSSRSVCVNCGSSCKLNSLTERCNSIGGRAVRGQRKLCCEFSNGVPSSFTFTWKTGRVCDDNKQKKLQAFCNALVGSTSCDSGLWTCSK